MRTIWIAAMLAIVSAGEAQVQAQALGRGRGQAQRQAPPRPPETEDDLLYRDGALIYGPGYDEAYRAGLAQGYEAGFDDGRDEEAAVRSEDRSRDDGRVRTTVTTAGYGEGRTRFTQVPRGTGTRADGRQTARARRR